MGDRIMWYEKCPNCGEEIDCMDASSSMIWSVHCDKCGYDDGLDYYDTEPNTIELLSKDEAKKRGFIK